MPINITWIDNCEGVEEIEHLHTPVCAIKIHSRQDVIIQIDWDFSQDVGAKGINDKRTVEYWPEPKQIVILKLFKQGPAHQNKVWAELLKIPLGSTLSYSALAKKGRKAQEPTLKNSSRLRRNNDAQETNVATKLSVEKKAIVYYIESSRAARFADVDIERNATRTLRPTRWARENRSVSFCRGYC